jgi:hypothetical protein
MDAAFDPLDDPMTLALFVGSRDAHEASEETGTGLDPSEPHLGLGIPKNHPIASQAALNIPPQRHLLERGSKLCREVEGEAPNALGEPPILQEGEAPEETEALLSSLG